MFSPPFSLYLTEFTHERPGRIPCEKRGTDPVFTPVEVKTGSVPLFSLNVVRYDNEAGKGDHKHIGEDEQAYRFHDINRLINDFQEDIRRWKNEHGNS